MHDTARTVNDAAYDDDIRHCQLAAGRNAGQLIYVSLDFETDYTNGRQIRTPSDARLAIIDSDRSTGLLAADAACRFMTEPLSRVQLPRQASLDDDDAKTAEDSSSLISIYYVS